MAQIQSLDTRTYDEIPRRLAATMFRLVYIHYLIYS